MKTRVIHTRFWGDSFINTLTCKEKLLFIYLLTNEKNNLIGIYEIQDKYILADLDLTQPELQKAKEKFREAKKILFWNGWVKIFNHDKYNSYKGEKVQKAVERELSEAPEYLKNTSIYTSMDGGIDTPNNQKPKTINKKLYMEKWNLEEVGELVVQSFNTHLGTRFKDSKSFLKGLERWLETYTPQEIEQAIKQVKYDKFWNGKMTPVILFRQKNPQGEPVDYIGGLLNNKEKYDDRQ